jgi:hypothetical protein
MSPGRPLARPSRCLGPELSAYADRSLCPDELILWDRHLVACTSCRSTVAAERRLLASLRGAGGPEVPSALRASLLSLGASAADDAGAARPPRDGCSPAHGSTPGRAVRRDGGPVVPPVPRRPAGPPAPIPVVHRTAPALHRSPVRATVFAGLAAGASAAAAWSFAVVGTPLAPPSPPRVPPGPAVQPARPSAPAFMGAALAARNLGTAPARLPVGAVGTGVLRTVVFPNTGPVLSSRLSRSAQSTP